MTGGSTSAARLRWRRIPPALAAALVALVLPLTAAADVTCAEGSFCVDRPRVEQCVLDARMVPRLRAESEYRLRDLRLLEGQHAALALVLDRTAAALAEERGRLPAGWWYLAGFGSGVVMSAVLLVAGLLLS